MGRFSEFKIVLRSLSEGKHTFDYKLDDSFFTLLNDEDNDLKKGKLDVVVDLKRSSTTFDLNFAIKGKVNVPCDRCLDDVTMEVDTKNHLVIKFGQEYAEESEEIMTIPEEEGEVNIAWFLYEFIVLSLPMKRVHPAGECNKTMAAKLKRHKVTDTKDEDSDDDIEIDIDDSDETDSRWDALKNLSFEDDK
ncbi:YceD family protein [Dysgonomonas massiliensis]|uniref:YceD family protein n=1 Tax=Dysgonomonas massiliensis TaxID=2040292 RepID=UPI000C75A2E9|nr:DUF177 domain-containing protein [Dysgonomonas massiliensis]